MSAQHYASLSSPMDALLTLLLFLVHSRTLQIAQGLIQKVDVHFKASVEEAAGERHFCEEITVVLENGDSTRLAVTGTVLGPELFDRAPQQQGRGVRLVAVADVAASLKRPLPPISS